MQILDSGRIHANREKGGGSGTGTMGHDRLSDE
jgi:hypothetical protein